MRLDHALALAADGFYVFPLLPDSKEPPEGMWFKELATRDTARIREWWERDPNQNIGIYTGRFGDDEALLVIDVDIKGEKRGDHELLRLEIEGFDFPDTCEQRTWSGGKHLIYRVGDAVKQGADVLASGLDIRSRGGYVVGSGSTVNGREYSRNRHGVSRAPQWLVDRCVDRRKKRTAPAIDRPAPALRHANADATRYLQKDAPLAIEGQSGDETTYKVAARCKDLGVSQDECLSLMLEHWNDRCAPPWSPDDLAAKVRNAYAYGIEPIGIAAPEAEFSAVESVPEGADTAKTEPAPAKPRLYFELFHQVAPQIDRAALVDNLLDHGAMSVLYGESNAGKTFVALDIAFHVASGKPWMDRNVEQGAAIYVAAEGGGRIRNRIAALREHYRLDPASVPLALIPCPIDLAGRGADVQPLIDLIAEVEQAAQSKTALIVIDTLARAMGGANENAPDDMGAFVRNVDRLRAATKAHLLVVHHSGKDRAKGARGHSSLRAATDTEIEIVDRTIKVTKQRDMDAGVPMGFVLEPIEIGRNDRGSTVTSCVVAPRSLSAEEEFSGKRVRAGSVPAKALEVLGNITMGSGKVTVAQWREEFIRGHYPEKRKAGWTAFDRARDLLVRDGLISEEHGHVCSAH